MPKTTTTKRNSKFEVLLHATRPLTAWDRKRVKTIYKGTDEAVMYSYVNALEFALETANDGGAEIEIIQDGQSRWIEYRDGTRIDLD
jgi:hypothetical protein